MNYADERGKAKGRHKRQRHSSPELPPQPIHIPRNRQTPFFCSLSRGVKPRHPSLECPPSIEYLEVGFGHLLPWNEPQIQGLPGPSANPLKSILDLLTGYWGILRPPA